MIPLEEELSSKFFTPLCNFVMPQNNVMKASHFIPPPLENTRKPQEVKNEKLTVFFPSGTNADQIFVIAL